MIVKIFIGEAQGELHIIYYTERKKQLAENSLMESNRKVTNTISEIKTLESLLPKAMHGDRHALSRKINHLKQLTTREKNGNEPTEKDIEKKNKRS